MKTIQLDCKMMCVVALLLLAVSHGCAGRGSPAGGFAGQGDQGPEIAEGGAIFRYYDKDADKVHLAGDFNNWSPAADPMIDRNGDGEWTLFYPLSPGRYEYKFVVDGVYWIADPKNPNAVSDGFEGRNSVIVFPN
jgi:1,4-alpha-glucan branching enzyme